MTGSFSRSFCRWWSSSRQSTQRRAPPSRAKSTAGGCACGGLLAPLQHTLSSCLTKHAIAASTAPVLCLRAPVCSGRLSLCRWALLYTLPDAAKGDVRRDWLNTILAELYDFFYK